MALLDIVILGAGLNGFCLAADAASRGFSVTLLDVANVPDTKEVNLPLVASEFMYSKAFDAAQLLKNLPEIISLTQRGPDLCQWLPASVLSPSAQPNLTQELSLFCYNKLRKIYKLQATNEQSEYPSTHVDCIIQTDILIEATKTLAESQGTVVEADAVIQSVKAKGQIWAFQFKTHENEQKKITARSVINCTGRSSIDIANKWFGYTSRCQVNTQWHHYLSYCPEEPIHQIFYLTDDHMNEYIYFPASPKHILIGSLATASESRETSFRKIKALLACYNLPPLTERNIKEQFVIPANHFSNDTPSNHQGYMIDLLCPEGVRPLVNIIGGNTSQCRLMAEQAIESLTDYLPTRKPCQTKTLPLPLTTAI